MNRGMILLRSVSTTGLMAAALFAGAGRLNVPPIWEYLGVYGAMMVVSAFLADPEMVQERLRPGGKPLDRRYFLLMALFLAHLVVAGMDGGRYHWAPEVPQPLQLGALGVLTVGLTIDVWAMRTNRFFSSVVRIQAERGHTLVTGGPYRWVRHPAYVATLGVILASGIALGSWAAVVVALPFVPFLLYRTVTEDAFLKKNLPGYEEYASRVRHRLLPGVW
jgi:protein-S-isoprenylcysteine O-methyltransferase Ste14